MKRIDVPAGTVFGRLTVIGEAPPMGPHAVRAVLCLCECGTTKAIRLGDLLHSGTKSCGCTQHEAVLNIPAGTVFGHLAVIEERRDSRDRRAMLCQCDCGQQKVVTVQSLRSGNTKSCGCRSSRNPRPREIDPANRTEIRLYGPKAAGRVALIDEEDFGLVSEDAARAYDVAALAAWGEFALLNLPEAG